VTTSGDLFRSAHMELPTNAFQTGNSSTVKGLNSPEGRKLSKAAGEFEAILFQSLWKSMKDTFKADGDPDADPTLEGYDDLGIQGLASAIGNAGGLGIKGMILQHLGPMLPGTKSGGAPAA
jgi:Rod binding domain-containing protein